MWDFHTHILPGIDDGASSMEESIEMIEHLKKLGFEGVVATPHANPMYVPDRHMLEELRDRLKRETGFDIIIGYEVAMDTLSVHDPEKLTIEGTRFILVELPWFDEKFDYEKPLLELIRRGLRPILAHPERHDHITMEDVKRIKGIGVLIQLNVKSLTGGYRREVQRRAMRYMEMADLMGSDAHSPEDYARFISKGVEYYEGKDFGRYKEQAH